MIMGRFLRDRSLWLATSLAAVGLIIGVMALAALDHHLPLDWSDLLYATGLSLLLILAAALRDYVLYRRMVASARHLCDHSSAVADLLPGQRPASELEREWHECLRTLVHHHTDALRNTEEERKLTVAMMTRWAHAMKTPLATTRLLLDQALSPSGVPLDDDWLQTLAKEHDRMARDVERLLYAARVDHVAVDVRPEPIRLEPMVRGLINDSRRDFIVGGVFPSLVVQETEAEPLVVYSDRKWLRFVLSQILDNAIKYARPPGASAFAKPSGTANSSETTEFSAPANVSETAKTVEIAVTRCGSQVQLRVTDHGVGIPQEDLGRIGHPFFTGQNGRDFPLSTGLGLYLAQRACSALGIPLRIQSERAVGTTITLLLPLDSEWVTVARR